MFMTIEDDEPALRRFDCNSASALRVLALVDDQFARMGYQVWPIPMTPEELAVATDAAIVSTENPRDFGERLAFERRSRGYEQ